MVLLRLHRLHPRGISAASEHGLRRFSPSVPRASREQLLAAGLCLARQAAGLYARHRGAGGALGGAADLLWRHHRSPEFLVFGVWLPGLFPLPRMGGWAPG